MSTKTNDTNEGMTDRACGIIILFGFIALLFGYVAFNHFRREAIVQPSGPVRIVDHYTEWEEGGHSMIVYMENGQQKRLPMIGTKYDENTCREVWKSIRDGEMYYIEIGHHHWSSERTWPGIVSVKPAGQEPTP